MHLLHGLPPIRRVGMKQLHEGPRAAVPEKCVEEHLFQYGKAVTSVVDKALCLLPLYVVWPKLLEGRQPPTRAPHGSGPAPAARTLGPGSEEGGERVEAGVSFGKSCSPKSGLGQWLQSSRPT